MWKTMWKTSISCRFKDDETGEFYNLEKLLHKRNRKKFVFSQKKALL